MKRTAKPQPAPALSADLRTWLHPIAPRQFVARHWKRRVQFRRGDAARLARLRKELGGFEVATLLALAAEPAKAWYVEDGKVNDSLRAGGALAAQLHRAGMTLYFDVDRAHPLYVQLAASAARWLGVSVGRLVLSIFATRKGNRTPCHVDDNENFTIQLTGHKRWRIHERPEVVPVSRWRRDGGRSPGRVVELTPGACLYCPGDLAHETESLDDSISLNLSFVPVTAAEYALPFIRHALSTQPRWQAPAPSLLGAGRQEGLRQLRALLETLPADLTGVGGELALPDEPEPSLRRRRGRGPGGLDAGAPRPPLRRHSRFRRRRHVTCSVDSGHTRGAGARPELVFKGFLSDARLAAEPAVIEVCRFIATRDDDFSCDDIAACLKGYDFASVRALVGRLIEVGFIHPLAASARRAP